MKGLAVITTLILFGLSVQAKGERQMATAEEIIKKLELKPLPEEGGYYRQTYKSDDPGLPATEFGIHLPRALRAHHFVE